MYDVHLEVLAEVGRAEEFEVCALEDLGDVALLCEQDGLDCVRLGARFGCELCEILRPHCAQEVGGEGEDAGELERVRGAEEGGEDREGRWGNGVCSANPDRVKGSVEMKRETYIPASSAVRTRSKSRTLTPFAT